MGGVGYGGDGSENGVPNRQPDSSVRPSRRRGRAVHGVLVGMVGALLALAGCGLDLAYLLPAARGQINLIVSSVPIEEAIAGGSLSDEQVAKLRLIQDARQYAADVIGLNTDENYTLFYDSHGQAVAHNVSACRKDAFVPKVWSFPLVGTVPYLGYFDLATAEAKLDALSGEGLDVFMYDIDAYSGLAFFPNPVLSPMLERSDASLLETVFHELLHSTIWQNDNTSFNESLATFFGRTGALHYLADRFPDQPAYQELARQECADSDRLSDYLLDLYNALDAFYSLDLPAETKVNGRETLFAAARARARTDLLPFMNDPPAYGWVTLLPANNAFMMGIRRYNLDLEVFGQVFAATGEDWVTTVSVFRAAAAATDPYAFLRAWLDSPTSPGVEAADAVSAKIHRDSPGDVPVDGKAVRGPCPTHQPTTILEGGRPE